MSEEQKPRIWAPVTIDAKQTRAGEFLRMSFPADKMIEWINQHKTEKGWVNMEIGKNKEGSKYSHSAWLDTWKPTPREGGGESRPATAAPPKEQHQPPRGSAPF
jgi:hypothetical protein